MICKIFRYIVRELQRSPYRFYKSITIGGQVQLAFSAKIKTNGGQVKIGRRTEILDGVLLFAYGGHIEIGQNCSVNPYTIIYGHGKGTSIGNNVLIAGHCMIIPNSHIFSDPSIPIVRQGETSSGIMIEDDVWLGHGCSVLDGVRIGRGSVVAAGSVVNKSVPPYSVVAGVPAKIISNRGLDKK